MHHLNEVPAVVELGGGLDDSMAGLVSNTHDNHSPHEVRENTLHHSSLQHTMVGESGHTQRRRNPKRGLNRRVFKDAVENDKDSNDDIEVRYINEDVGRGVFARVAIPKGNFICRYPGTLRDKKETNKYWKKYETDPDKYGSFMYYIKVDGSDCCIDATSSEGRIGQLINHSLQEANVSVKHAVFDGKPQIHFFANRDILPGEELVYPYREIDKEAIDANPWLAQ